MGATTTNTAHSLASFFMPTEYVSAEEKQLERKKYSKRKVEVKAGAFNISALYFTRISPLLQHTFLQKETQRNEGSVASLRITLLIDKRQGNKVIKVTFFSFGVERAFLSFLF